MCRCWSTNQGDRSKVRYSMPQHFPQGPAMVGNACSHSRSSPHSPLGEQARMVGAEVVERAHQVHARVKSLHSARQTAGAPAKTSQPSTEGGIQSLDVGRVEYSPAL